MTHSPPIPPGNQSPYPVIEPPHSDPASPAPPAADATDEGRTVTPAMIAGAVVAGAAAFAATAFVRSRRKAASEPAPVKRPARTAAKPATAKAPKPRVAKAKKPRAGTPRTSSDDKANRGPQDASRIAMSEDYEVRYWTRKFGVDRAALQAAVDAVGNGAAAVERELGKS